MVLTCCKLAEGVPAFFLLLLVNRTSVAKGENREWLHSLINRTATEHTWKTFQTFQTAEQQTDSRRAGGFHHRRVSRITLRKSCPDYYSSAAAKCPGLASTRMEANTPIMNVPTPQLELWGYTRTHSCDLRTLTLSNALGVIISKAPGICFIIWLPLVVQCLCVCVYVSVCVCACLLVCAGFYGSNNRRRATHRRESQFNASRIPVWLRNPHRGTGARSCRGWMTIRERERKRREREREEWKKRVRGWR